MTRALTAVVAEDEPLLRAEIRQTLADLWPELEICAEAADGIQAIEALESFAPDILFLDIQMPGRNGLEVARHASGKAHVIFITAYDAYALQAFEQGALDYILKPISTERVKVAVDRLKERLREPPADLSWLADMLKSVVSAEPRYLKIRKLKSDQDAISHKLEETSTRIDQLNLESTMSNRISIRSAAWVWSSSREEAFQLPPLPLRYLPTRLAAPKWIV